MSSKKILIGIILIILSFSTIFLTLLPNLYSDNTAGKINKEVEVQFNFLKKETSPFVLMYFGFVGCHTICPPALNDINKIYSKLDKDKYSFYFINLTHNSSKNDVKLFIESFNKDFKGIYLNNKQIPNIVNALNVRYLPSLSDKNEIEHSGFLHVLKKTDKGPYEQKFIYTTKPFDVDFIIEDLNNL